MNVDMFLQLAKNAEQMDVYPSIRFPPSLYYRFMRLLAARLRPSVSVELGVCSGGGSLHLALGNPDGKVIGVDLDNQYPENIDYVKETCPNFEFWQMDSIEAAARYDEADLSPVDILFIDTIHTYERTIAEFVAWDQFLALEAVVVLDDLFRGGMDRLWQELPGEKARFDSLHIGDSPTDGGFGVVYNIH